MRCLSTCRAAVTLLELLLVLLVVGVLAAIAVPSFTTVRTNSDDAALVSSLEAWGRAAAAHASSAYAAQITAADFNATAPVTAAAAPATNTPKAGTTDTPAGGMIPIAATDGLEEPWQEPGTMSVTAAESVSWLLAAATHRGEPYVAVGRVTTAGTTVRILDPGGADLTQLQDVRAVFDHDPPDSSDSSDSSDQIPDTDGFSGGVLATTWDTTLANTSTVTLPLAGEIDVQIDWGDGTSETVATTAPMDDPHLVSHTYDTDGQYTVEVDGTLGAFSPGSDINAVNPSAELLISVDAWDGQLGLARLDNAFRGATNLTAVPDQLPPSVSSTHAMFRDATSFNQDLNSWDVSQVVDFSSMFRDATAFNGDISNWNTAQATNLSQTFRGATSFNQNLNSWDVSNVIALNGTFYNATSFNQDLNNWDVSQVTTLLQTFRGAQQFDGSLAGWDTAAVENLNRTFMDASSFSGDISGWNTSQVTTMTAMFYGATAFNSDISGWNTIRLVSLASTFAHTEQFNADISGWDVRRVEQLDNAFDHAARFNQDLRSWQLDALVSADNYDRDAALWQQQFRPPL